MQISPYRLFFDTSAYVAALYSPSGAAGELFRLAEAGVIRMVVSEQVIVESDRVLGAKFPGLVQENRRLWKALAPDIAPHPSASETEPFLKILPVADAQILCAARLEKVTAFVTWNTRDFMTRGVDRLVPFPILVPAGALKHFRGWIEPFLE